MFAPTFAILLTLAIYQVAAAPVDGRVESDGTYKRLYLPYIESVAKDGTIKILTSEDLLGLAKKLEAGDIPVTTIHRIIGVNNFNNTLSDHQLRRMANHEVAAIVNPEDMKKPGFGHLFLTIDDKGIIQTFIYNLTLEEAMEKAKNEGYPNSSSEDSYHQNKPKSASD
ncbi:uncharacterized protein [Choristoneura fumiferana]|uniref:uncharacterized protein n=1 Tax=Choristoneura fumiferana TaxID=7141 RepID=UPI003D15C063